MRRIHRSKTPSERADALSPLMLAIEGIVADTNDPEQMHRVKVVIPSIDESYIHGEWVTFMQPWVGSPGYGPVHLPDIGSEVLLFGRLGDPHMLFCLSRFNEDYTVPAEFADGARGVKDGWQIQTARELAD